MGRPLVVHKITRIDRVGGSESLAFGAGMNLIVGMPNTGKTQWLRMLDYLLGYEGKAEEAFDEQLAQKYVELRAEVTIGDKRSTLVRRWHEANVKSKIVVDDVSLSTEDFNNQLQERLGITPIKYPQGDAHAPRAWPTLGWRSLLRQIYRRQDSWASVAQNQVDSEQHAVLLQFLGAATKIFAAQFRELIDRENQMTALRAQKENYQSALNMVTRELLNESDALSLTDQVIDARVAELKKSDKEIEDERNRVIEGLRKQVATPGLDLDGLSAQAAELRQRRAELTSSRSDARLHLAELQQLRERLASEVDRLARAKLAGTVFGRLKVTHCPVCDQRVSPESPEGTCYLCHQHTEPSVVSDAKRRFAQEQSQIEGELDEADEVIADAKRSHDEIVRELRAVNAKLSEVEQTLAPIRAQVATLLPPEVQELDQRLGAVRERTRQMEGFRAALGKRQELAQQLDALEKEIAELEKKVQESRGSADLVQLGDDFADRINNYLTALRRANPKSWTQSEVSVKLERRGITIKVGDSRWNRKLGGTMTLYFLLAYNHALLSMFPEAAFNYPGLAVLDLPAKLDDGSETADKENFVLEPFQQLLIQDSMREAQVIVTGSAFENFPGNRIVLTNVWK